jgi:HK97 family phage major capsid protein
LAENAIINGTGVGQPQGILGAPCLVSQAAEALQGDTVVAENLVHMWERRWAPGNYVWLINQEVESQLMMLDLPAGGAGALVYLPPGGFSGAPYGSIFGRPVLVTEYNQELGTAGDIILADLSQYYLATKGGIQEAMSIHVHFVYDESVFRFVMRVEGQPAWSSALTPFEATTGHTVSPFVALATR